MARESKIGLLVIISISLLIWGFLYLKGKNLLSSDQVFYAEYENVDQLLISNPVLINGYQVGLVTKVYQNPENLQKIVVEMTVNRTVKLPKGTIAEINTTSIMGGKAIKLLYEGTCSGDDCLESGDYLIGVTRDLLNSMVGAENVSEIYDVVDKVKVILDSVNIQTGGEGGDFQETVQDVQEIIANLNNTTARLDYMLATSTNSITSSLKSVASITSNLEASNAKITSILENAELMTKQLKDADLGKTVESANTTIDQLQGSLTTIDAAVKDLNVALAKLKTTDNTLGLLFNDKELYDNLNVTLKNVELLTQDIRLHPKRYTRVLSKKEKPYEYPEGDPAFGEGDDKENN